MCVCVIHSRVHVRICVCPLVQMCGVPCTSRDLEDYIPHVNINPY